MLFLSVLETQYKRLIYMILVSSNKHARIFDFMPCWKIMVSLSLFGKKQTFVWSFFLQWLLSWTVLCSLFIMAYKLLINNLILKPLSPSSIHKQKNSLLYSFPYYILYSFYIVFTNFVIVYYLLYSVFLYVCECSWFLGSCVEELKEKTLHQIYTVWDQ